MEFGDKNYLGACTQGVFSNKVHVGSIASKAFKGVLYVFFLKPLNSFYHFPPAPPPEVEPPPKLPPEEPPLLLYPLPRPEEEELRVRLAIV